MKRLRETSSGLLLAAACGGSPIESTTVLANEGSSTSEVASTGIGTTLASSESTTSAGEEASSAGSTAETSTTGPDPDSSGSGSETGIAACTPILHEILYDPDSGGTDDEFEWIEIYNPCGAPIDLGAYELRWGGEGYVSAATLSGELDSEGCFVVGGPLSVVENHAPVFDLELDFEGDLENADSAADAIALFVQGDDVPVDAVIYGEENVFAIIDETGVPGTPDVMDVPRGHSIARDAADRGASWVDADMPSPNKCPNPGL